MPLKDWKKVDGYESSWQKKNDTVTIMQDKDFNIQKILWEVEIYLFDKDIIRKSFINRADAIKFAKEYMKKH
jgi:hypothetical protein